jgi:TrmH family RNA methyltransferase
VGTTGPTRPLADELRAARCATDRAVLEGLNPLKHALRFGAEVELAVTSDPEALHRLARELAPDVADRVLALATPVPRELMRAVAPRVHTDVIAIARRPPLDLAAALAPRDAPAVLLEDPRHLGNVGAAIRVAAAAGAAAVLTSGDVDPWDPVVIRGSAGLLYALPVARVDGFDHGGRPLVALDPAGESIEEATPPADALLAFGSERRGLSDALLARADLRVAIPMRAGVSSLNLATSVATVLYAWRLREPRATG